ncbi:hypothetical protein CYMTET_15927, partial [Cymbomonas tetramitiformis]
MCVHHPHGKLLCLSLVGVCATNWNTSLGMVALPAHPQATWSRGTGSFLAPQQFLYGLPSPCIYHAAEEAHVGAIPPTELLDIIQEHPLGGLTLITTMLRQAVEEAAEHLRPSPPLALASSTMSLTEVMPIVLKAHQATGCFGALPGPSESHVKMLRILLQAAHFRKVGWRQCVMRRGCRFLEVVIVLHGTLQMRAGAAKSPVLGELQIGSFLGSAAWLHDPQVECPEEVYAGDGDDGALLAQLPLAALELLNKEHPYIARPLFFAMAAKEVDAQLRRLSPCLQMPKPDEVEVQKMQHLLAMSEVEKAEIGRQFRGFGDEELRQLEKCVDLWLFQEGQFVWSSTLRDRWVGVVVQGSALVLRDGKQVGSLQVGDLLGEITSFVETRLEPAKVVGEAGDCMVAAFRWDQLEALHEQNPELGLQMLRLVFGTAARKLGCLRGLCDANGLTARTDMINTELIPATKLFLMLQVACSAQWKKKIGARADQILRLHHLYDLALHMHTVAFKAGDLVYERGTPGLCMLMVLEGQVQVYSGKGGRLRETREIGQFVGEEGFIKGERLECHRSSTVYATGLPRTAVMKWRSAMGKMMDWKRCLNLNETKSEEEGGRETVMLGLLWYDQLEALAKTNPDLVMRLRMWIGHMHLVRQDQLLKHRSALEEERKKKLEAEAKLAEAEAVAPEPVDGEADSGTVQAAGAELRRCLNQVAEEAEEQAQEMPKEERVNPLFRFRKVSQRPISEEVLSTSSERLNGGEEVLPALIDTQCK